MATGAIAYDLLAPRYPDVIAGVVALMAQHPDHARFDTALAGLTGAARDRMMFELIARWPDEIRKTRYNRTHWHHQLSVVSGWTGFPLRLGAADHAFFHNLRIVRNERAAPGARAVALCWLVHVLGDMHQPLHAGHRMDWRFPLTDRAGTLGWVRSSPDAAPVRLHRFWDQAGDRPEEEQAGAASIAASGERMLALSPVEAQDPKSAYRHTVEESEQLAAEISYQGVALSASQHAARAPLLPLSYVANARAVADGRIGRAGARIADMLSYLLGTP